MNESTTHQEKLVEREELLRLCCGMDVLKAREYSQKLDDEKFVQLINQIQEDLLSKGMRKPESFPENYYGKHYTILNSHLSTGSVWEEVKKSILECLASDQAERVKQVLEYLLDQRNYETDFTTLKAKFAKFRNALDKLLGYGLVKKVTVKETTRYSLYKELAPLIREVLTSEEAAVMPVIRSDEAQRELEEVKKMEESFNEYLEELLADRLDETIEFGKKLSIGFIAEYLEEMFGPILYFDVLLALAQQYGMTDTLCINPEGGPALHTGFHLALFGSPGTGKTFAVKELMIGDKDKGVKGHGLVGLNRYCGGMTPANFIRIGEAYQGKRFNFVVTEFNDWFRYKGMVESLKVALEQGEIRYETKHEVVGPYKFRSFFTTNYNTKIEGKAGYRVTIADPNFNAIEDRMLVRLHRMTKERLKELIRSQRELAMGKIKMQYADLIRDHLVLVYAIQTEHELVKGKFKKKKIVVRESAFKKLEQASNLILDQLEGPIRFSVRVQKNALKLASALTLPSFFAQEGDNLEITPEALNLAMKFFVEEIAIRQRVEIDASSVLYKLGISELSRVVNSVTDVKKKLKNLEDEERAKLFQERIDQELRFLKKEFLAEIDYEKYEKILQKVFRKNWDLLDQESRQFLITAEILLDVFASVKDEKVDYAPVIVEYAKAFEQELIGKIFGKFKAHLRDKDMISGEELFKFDWESLKLSPSDLKSFKKTCEIFESYLKDQIPMTLGAAWYILHEASQHYSSRCNLFFEFESFVKDIKLAEYVFSREFIKGLKEFIEKHRNKAAHLDAISMDESKKCRGILLTVQPKLLVSFANSLSPIKAA